MSETLVTAAEIARLAGVGRAAVSNWRRRHPDFPEPVVGSGATPAFRLDEVERWLREQGKLAAPRPDDVLRRLLDAARTAPDPARLVASIAAYLRDPRTVDPPDARVREALADLGDGSPDELIEGLCTWLFERQQRQHLVTPPELARLMIELAAPVTGTVFDPACGPGNLLRAAIGAGAHTAAGQETDPALARLARARLGPRATTNIAEGRTTTNIAEGRTTTNIAEGRTTTNIAEGDALRSDAFTGLRADVVVCDPPFGYRDWGHEELALDPRWEYGFPVKGEPELAWVQHCLAHTEPGGTTVLALPAGVASRRAGRAIRQALLRRGVVRAVVALPPGVLMSTGIPIHLWVLRNPAAPGADPVLLVEAGQHRPRRRGRVDWTALHDDVLGTWREFRDTGTVSDVPGRRRVVEPIELLDEDVDLTPARHLPPPRAELDVPALERTRAELARTLTELGALLPRVAADSPAPRACTTLHELARAGAVTLRHQTGALELDDGENATGPLVLTGRDVATGNAPTARLAGTSREEPVRLRPGDLVVPLLAAGDSRPRTRVIDTDDLLLGPNLQLIRVDEERMDVHFLAGQIRAGSASAGSTTASGVHRIDVRRIEIPVLDRERQRRLGAVFRRLAEFESGLRQATEVGAELTRHLTDGLADGTVVPED